MKRYEAHFKESKEYIDFGSKNSFVTLEGTFKKITYSVNIQWYSSNLLTSVSIKNEDGSTEHIYDKSTNLGGGSPAQTLTPLFYNVLKVSVPVTDDLGSGLDVNYMIDVLIKKYKFKIKK